MKKYKTNIKDLFFLKSTRFNDKRGFLRELVKEKIIRKKFPFVIVSKSKKNVLRGLHLQTKKTQAKFISVIKGSILDVAVDLRKKSKTYGKFFKIILNDKNCKSLFIPENFAHGFLGLDKENIVIYSCSNYRSAKSEVGIKWNDKNLRIRWPVKNPIISKKDKSNIAFEEFKKEF
tara:strand:+ start:33 stop:557 length:525 start_codon:yes stop_codon:yes gene_type:complete